MINCKKIKQLFVLCSLLILNVSRGQVLINEYSTSNLTSFVDNFGSNEDFIELYNTSATAVNLTGYHLSNKSTNLGKWTIGAGVTISGNGILRIWASNRNVNTGLNLHTNFSLKQCTFDKIILSNPSLTVLDSFTVKKTQAGHSRGRKTNGAPTWSVFTTPTPNASNNTSTPFLGYSSAPVMSLPQGFYSGPQTLSIVCPDAGSSCKYTINGSSPATSSSITYFTAIAIPNTMVIRAQATSTNVSMLPSFVESNTYFISVTHSVAVVSVFGDGVGVLFGGSAIVTETGLEYFTETGVYKAEADGQANKHGNDSWSYPQRGIDFVCRDEYGYNDALKYQIFNSKTRNEFQRIILKASANDNYPFECPVAGNPYAWGDPTLYDAAHIRDAYVHTVAQKANMHLDGRTWVPGILYVNGAYWGVYDFREKVDDKDFTKYYWNSSEDSLQYLQTWGSTWSAYGGTQAQTDWNTFVSYVAANSMTVAANYAYVDSVYSTKSLADYVILNSYAVTSDWLNWNTAWWRGMNSSCNKKKWRYTLWDEDATFHHYVNYTGVPNLNSNADPCDPSTLSNPGGEGHIPILNKLLTNSIFKQYYVMRYFDLLNTGLSCKRMTDILDSMINVIKPEMPGQIAKWGGTMAAWQTNVNNLKTFIQARCDTITKLFNTCYNVTGPYIIKVNVDPPNSGTVDFNSLNLGTFTWQGTYPGNLPNILKAHPKPNYCFSHWTTKTHTLSPSMTDSVVTLLLMSSDSIVAHYIYNPKPTVTPSNTSMCVGNPVQLQASNGINYTWIPSTGLSCTTCSNPIASPSVYTTYTVISTASAAIGCKASNTVTMSITANPQVLSSPISTNVCVGQSAYLVASNGSNYNWAPSNGLSCPTCPGTYASPTVTTVYTVTSNNSLLCSTTATQIINVLPYANAAFTATNNAMTGFPQTLTITNTSSSASSYSWSLSNGSTATSTVPSFVINNPGTYTLILIAYGNNGCNDTTRSIIVADDIIKPQPSVTFPNVFTPNGDGTNDFFLPIMKEFADMEVSVYDRWGILVHEMHGITDKWLGETTKGKECPAGTYFYVFTGKDLNGKNYVYKGYVQLLR